MTLLKKLRLAALGTMYEMGERCQLARVSPAKALPEPAEPAAASITHREQEFEIGYRTRDGNTK